jgi:hypothetical protein
MSGKEVDSEGKDMYERREVSVFGKHWGRFYIHVPHVAYILSWK